MRNRKGYTLIEVLIALFIIVIATTSILIVLGKLVNMAGQQPGTSINLARATAIAQEQLDRIRGIEFPPVNEFPLVNGIREPFANVHSPNGDYIALGAAPGPAPGQNYSYEIDIGAYDGIQITPINNDIDDNGIIDPAEREYIDSTDKLLLPVPPILPDNMERNIFRITVRVYQGRAIDPNRQLLVTASTYKVRNGYF